MTLVIDSLFFNCFTMTEIDNISDQTETPSWLIGPFESSPCEPPMTVFDHELFAAHKVALRLMNVNVSLCREIFRQHKHELSALIDTVSVGADALEWDGCLRSTMEVGFKGHRFSCSLSSSFG